MKAIILLLLLACARIATAQIVYDNLTTPANQFLDWNTEANLGAVEVANQITLQAAPSASLSSLVFEYFASNLIGSDNTATVKIYSVSQAQEPGTVLYQSAAVPVFDTTGAGTRVTLPNLAVNLPAQFFVSLRFDGITAGETVGPTLYSPPAVGSVSPDFWTLEDVGWVDNAGATVDFGLQLAAVPEPCSMLAMGACAVGMAVLLKRRA